MLNLLRSTISNIPGLGGKQGPRRLPLELELAILEQADPTQYRALRLVCKTWDTYIEDKLPFGRYTQRQWSEHMNFPGPHAHYWPASKCFPTRDAPLYLHKAVYLCSYLHKVGADIYGAMTGDPRVYVAEKQLKRASALFARQDTSSLPSMGRLLPIRDWEAYLDDPICVSAIEVTDLEHENIKFSVYRTDHGCLVPVIGGKIGEYTVRQFYNDFFEIAVLDYDREKPPDVEFVGKALRTTYIDGPNNFRIDNWWGNMDSYQVTGSISVLHNYTRKR